MTGANTTGRIAGQGAGVRIANDAIRSTAGSLLERPVDMSDLALVFDESAADSADLHVGGPEFYPRMLDDIAAAASSVHIDQFGFKPGVIGDRFAEALIAKAASGVPVRLIVDGRGSDPDARSKDMYGELTAAGATVCVVRAVQPRVAWGPIDGHGPTRWNLHGLGHFDHRKLLIVDGRTAWVGGAGIEDHFFDGRFHDMFVRTTGPVVSQFQLVFLASLRWLGGTVRPDELDSLFPELGAGVGSVPAVALHNAPGRCRPISAAITNVIEGAESTLDIANPYVADRGMIRRIAAAARRGVEVRLFVPANANNWACAAAQQHHHGELLDAGVRILGYPTMLHAKAFVADRRDVLIGTCNLEAWSLKRFFEIDIRVRSAVLAARFDERFASPAEQVSRPGERLAGPKQKLKASAFAAISPLL